MLVLLFCSDIIINQYNTATIHVDVLFIYCISLSIIYMLMNSGNRWFSLKGIKTKWNNMSSKVVDFTLPALGVCVSVSLLYLLLHHVQIVQWYNTTRKYQPVLTITIIV